MRTLYLCRHGKSSWADPGMQDFDRPLNERGMHDAPMMAGRFKQRNEPLDLMVSSTAKRALSTAHAFADVLGATERGHFDAAAARPQLVLQPRLYHADVRSILDIVNALPDAAQHVMLFGHNPGFTEAVAFFSSDDIGNLPTCGMVRIDFPCDAWAEASRDYGLLVWRDQPKPY